MDSIGRTFHKRTLLENSLFHVFVFVFVGVVLQHIMQETHGNQAYHINACKERQQM